MKISERLQAAPPRIELRSFNANKTYENRSVRTGQSELTNRRQDLALPKFNQQPTNAETIEKAHGEARAEPGA